MKKSITIEARDLLSALREAREAGATAIQLATSCNVCPLDEYIEELELDDSDPGEASYVRFGRYIVDASDAWGVGAETYILHDI